MRLESFLLPYSYGRPVIKEPERAWRDVGRRIVRVEGRGGGLDVVGVVVVVVGGIWRARYSLHWWDENACKTIIMW